MQRFNFFVEDGFRYADRTVRDGLRQTAACEQATGNKRQRPPGWKCDGGIMKLLMMLTMINLKRGVRRHNNIVAADIVVIKIFH
ncbi:hypothetical protein nublan011_31950 [Klebsiella pneumoniae]|uniref:hypothetical protein n=1 Tax=Klebsiella pneumoniae TaxID=573 RepID=UPI00178CCB75